MDLFRQSDHVLDMSMSMLDGSTEDYMSYELVKLSDRGRSSPWPTTTQTACWHCCHQFANAPVGVPVDTTGSNHRLMGNFCSFNCAYAWALGQANHHTDYTAGCRVKQFAAEVFEVDPVSIVAAPDPLVLEMFGGPMSIEQFRGNVDNVRVIQEPFVSSHMLLCTVRTHENTEGREKARPGEGLGERQVQCHRAPPPKGPSAAREGAVRARHEHRERPVPGSPRPTGGRGGRVRRDNRCVDGTGNGKAAREETKQSAQAAKENMTVLQRRIFFFYTSIVSHTADEHHPHHAHCVN